MSIRSQADDQRWRLAALDEIEGWRDFCIAWSSCAFLREYGMPHLSPMTMTDNDDLLAWAWDIVDSKVGDAIAVCCSRCRLDDLSVVAGFDALQGASLIYPDGSVSQRVLERISRDMLVTETQQMLFLSKANEEIRAIQARANRKAKP
jgi:hypothetical protein